MKRKKKKKKKNEERKKVKAKKQGKKRQSVLHLLGLQLIALASVINSSLDASCNAGYEGENMHLFGFKMVGGVLDDSTTF